MNHSVYDFFVRKNPSVQYEYERYVQEHLVEHHENRFKHWKILWKLNWHYRAKKISTPLMYWDTVSDSPQDKDISTKNDNIPAEPLPKVVPRKAIPQKAAPQKAAPQKAVPQKAAPQKAAPNLPYLKGAESRSTKWIPPHDLVRQFMDYDVISFDIFDTLIFRPFEKPQDLFILLGMQLDILDFITIRMNAERTLRDKKFEQYGHRELTLKEIYLQIESETGLNHEKGIRAELSLEEDLCFANPYMKYVFETLLAQDKRIVLLSDMYIPGDKMKSLLKKCGYDGYEQLFISCDHACSKRDGGLFRNLKEYLADNTLICIHIGDNPASDISSAMNEGFETYFYENINAKGKKYRTNEIPGLIGRAYRGIVNSHLHNGYQRFDAYYEYGFTYGGLFLFGYAQYIHQYALTHQIDKILFVARDGYIIKKVYDLLFSDISSEYMLCSRISNLKLSAYCSKNDYLKEFVLRWTKEKKEISVRDVLQNMDLHELTAEFETYLNPDEMINEANTQILLDLVNEHWPSIVKTYESYIQLSREYYGWFFEDAKKVLVVDIGWRGQGILALRNLERDYWHFGCEIYGMLAASAPTRACIGQLQSGIIDTYLFSPIKNVSCFESHSKQAINNILMELFAGAPSPSFRGFEKDGDSYSLAFDVPETANYPMISNIHQGILDFAGLYSRHFSSNPFMYQIAGYDAYMPIKHIFKDYSYMKRFFGKYEFQDFVGGTSGENSRKVSDLFKKFNL